MKNEIINPSKEYRGTERTSECLMLCFIVKYNDDYKLKISASEHSRKHQRCDRLLPICFLDLWHNAIRHQYNSNRICNPSLTSVLYTGASYNRLSEMYSMVLHAVFSKHCTSKSGLYLYSKASEEPTVSMHSYPENKAKERSQWLSLLSYLIVKTCSFSALKQPRYLSPVELSANLRSRTGCLWGLRSVYLWNEGSRQVRTPYSDSSP